MAAKNLEKALYGPSLVEVALGALLGLILGLLAACAFLVFKPVVTVMELPKKIDRGTVYYIAGHESSAKSKGWQNKLKQFAAGGNIVVVEDELNAWAAALGAAGAPAAPTPAAPKSATPAPAAPKPEEAKPATDGIFSPGRPNFRLVDGKLQIGFGCTLNWYGLTQDVVVKTTGTFRHDGDGVVYVPDTFYLGSCPMHLLPAVAGPLAAHLLTREKVPDDVRSAWAKLKDATIDGTTLKLVVQ